MSDLLRLRQFRFSEHPSQCFNDSSIGVLKAKEYVQTIYTFLKDDTSIMSGRVREFHLGYHCSHKTEEGERKRCKRGGANTPGKQPQIMSVNI